MKLLIIGFTKIKYMPYMNFYLDKINTQKNKVDVIYWNRDLKEEEVIFDKKIVYHEFKCYQEDDVKKILKIKNFLKFKKYTEKIIKENNYDFVIVLHTLPGVLIYKTLKSKFTNKYILDYRDFTYESFKPFKNIIHKLVKYSKYTFVSSDKYRKYLPSEYENKTFTSHNIMTNELNIKIQSVSKKKHDKIRIAYWGFIREEEINKEIIRKISSDERFELHYYGREQQVALNLKKYVKENNINNIYFHGEYKPKDRLKFSNETDLIHNIFSSKNMMMSMSNKYYDSIMFKIPLLCMENSFMGEKVTKNGIGIEINPYDNSFNDRIYQYYTKLKMKDFFNNCDKELNNVLEEIKKSDSIIKKIFK